MTLKIRIYFEPLVGIPIGGDFCAANIMASDFLSLIRYFLSQVTCFSALLSGFCIIQSRFVLMQSFFGHLASNFETMLFFPCPHVSSTLPAVGLVWLWGIVSLPLRFRATRGHFGLLRGVVLPAVAGWYIPRLHIFTKFVVIFAV